MHSSKKKKMALVVAFCMLIAVLSMAVEYMVYPPTYVRAIISEMYKQEDLGAVFVGASHCQHSMQPYIFEDATGEESFNLSTPAQPVESSYYLLKEALKKSTPKWVVFDVDYSFYTTRVPSPYASVIIGKSMKPSLNKLAYYVEQIGSMDLRSMFVPWGFWFRSNIKDAGKIMAIKQTDAYKAGDASAVYTTGDKDTSVYMGKGYLSSTEALSEEKGSKVTTKYKWHRDDINEDTISYLKKMVEMCKEKGVEFVMVSSPVPESTLLSIKNYDDVHDYFSTFAEDNGVNFYDFNLVRTNVLDRSDSGFIDYDGHMNDTLADDYTKLVAEVIEKNDNGSLVMDDYFYASEKDLENDLNQVCNVWFNVDRIGGDVTVKAKSVQSKHVVPEYQFILTNSDTGETQVIQDYSENNEVKIDAECGDYMVRVNAREKGSDAEYTRYYEYWVAIE